MVAFVGIGDLHLSSSPKKEDHDAYVFQLVRQCLVFAKEQGIKHILLYGDVGDKPYLSRSAMRTLLRLFRSPFTFHIILGNHDKEAEDSAAGHSLMPIVDLIKANKLPTVHVYEEDTNVVIEGAKIRFMPWPSVAFKPNCLNVAHVTVSGTRYKSVVVNKGYDGDCLAVIGHEHDCQRIRNTYYSGTLYQTNFGEKKEKFFHHIIFDDGEFTIKNVPIKNLKTLHTVASRKELAALRKTLGPNDEVKVVVSASSDLTAEDYADLNVTRVDPSLQLEQVSGSQIEFSTTEFFIEWLDAQNLTKAEKEQLKELRNAILH